jgi:hypothetical protein
LDRSLQNFREEDEKIMVRRTETKIRRTALAGQDSGLLDKRMAEY